MTRGRFYHSAAQGSPIAGKQAVLLEKDLPLGCLPEIMPLSLASAKHQEGY